MTEGQHDLVNSNGSRAVDHDGSFTCTGFRFYSSYLSNDPHKRMSPGARLFCVIEKAREILAIDLARDKRRRPDARIDRSAELDKMVRVLGKRAHVPGRYVQKMLGTLGAIRDTSRHLAGPIDQNNLQRLPYSWIKQTDRSNGPAKAGTDDGYSLHWISGMYISKEGGRH
jgi:hypothetical protein